MKTITSRLIVFMGLLVGLFSAGMAKAAPSPCALWMVDAKTPPGSGIVLSKGRGFEIFTLDWLYFLETVQIKLDSHLENPSLSPFGTDVELWRTRFSTLPKYLELSKTYSEKFEELRLEEDVDARNILKDEIFNRLMPKMEELAGPLAPAAEQLRLQIETERQLLNELPRASQQALLSALRRIRALVSLGVSSESTPEWNLLHAWQKFTHEPTEANQWQVQELATPFNSTTESTPVRYKPMERPSLRWASALVTRAKFLRVKKPLTPMEKYELSSLGEMVPAYEAWESIANETGEIEFSTPLLFDRKRQQSARRDLLLLHRPILQELETNLLTSIENLEERFRLDEKIWEALLPLTKIELSQVIDDEIASGHQAQLATTYLKWLSSTPGPQISEQFAGVILPARFSEVSTVTIQIIPEKTRTLSNQLSQSLFSLYQQVARGLGWQCKLDSGRLILTVTGIGVSELMELEVGIHTFHGVDSGANAKKTSVVTNTVTVALVEADRAKETAQRHVRLYDEPARETTFRVGHGNTKGDYRSFFKSVDGILSDWESYLRR